MKTDLHVSNRSTGELSSSHEDTQKSFVFALIVIISTIILGIGLAIFIKQVQISNTSSLEFLNPSLKNQL
jgi:hypothetical protein